MWLLPFAVATCLVVCAALALLLAPLNVYARDTMHLLELLVLGWFWVTPILYQYERGRDLVRPATGSASGCSSPTRPRRS